MLRETVLNILDSVWPMLVIICTIYLSLRITYHFRSHQKVVFYKEILYLGFIIYVICLFHTVTFQDVSWSSSNFIPFKEMLRYNFGSPLFIRNVLGNVLLFIPYGFFIGYLFQFKKAPIPIFLTVILSIVIETTQLLIGRVFDVDDILLNILGGTLGYFLVSFMQNIKGHLPSFLKKPVFYNIIMVLALVIVFLYLFEIIKLEGVGGAL